MDSRINSLFTSILSLLIVESRSFEDPWDLGMLAPSLGSARA